MKAPAEGLAIMMGPEENGPAMGDEEEEGEEKALARAAFQALKDDDEDSFVDAFVGAVKACALKSEAPGYEDDEE